MRSLHQLVLGLSFAAAAFAPGLAAQTFPTTGPGVVAGTVVDSATGVAIPRSSVCATFRMTTALWTARCAAVDTAGNFRLENLPPGRHLVYPGCTTTEQFGKGFEGDTIEFSEAEPHVRHWRIDSSGCYTRFPQSRDAELRGHYSFGFEMSTFTPCPASAWYEDDDSLARGSRLRWTWVSFDERSRRSPVRWPSLEGSPEYPRYYVHWRGTVSGPGYYGHLGGSRYLLVVDSVLDVRVPGNSDCR